MATVIQFCEKLGLSPRAGATDAGLNAFESKTGLTLPPEIRAFYRASNGLDVAREGFMILSLDSALPMALALCGITVFEHYFGYFPFIDFNDSNPHCVACRPPLSGRVVRVFHDDEPVLQFRSINTFLDAVLDSAAKSDDEDSYWLLNGLHGVYEVTEERTPEDLAAGQELLRTGRGLQRHEPGRTDLLRFGVSLLQGEYIDDIAGLLYEEHYVREAAIQRLQRIGGPRATAEVDRVTMEMTRFSEQAASALREAGLTVTTVSPHRIQLDPGPVHLNMDFLFDERERPDVFAYIVERAKFFLSEKVGK